MVNWQLQGLLQSRHLTRTCIYFIYLTTQIFTEFMPMYKRALPQECAQPDFYSSGVSCRSGTLTGMRLVSMEPRASLEGTSAGAAAILGWLNSGGRGVRLDAPV